LEWDIAERELNKLKVSSNGKNELVTVKESSDKFECIGVGTDAAVFRFLSAPQYAFKVFSNDKLENEIEVYLKLGRSEYFPVYYGRGLNFLFQKKAKILSCLHFLILMEAELCFLILLLECLTS